MVSLTSQEELPLRTFGEILVRFVNHQRSVPKSNFLSLSGQVAPERVEVDGRCRSGNSTSTPIFPGGDVRVDLGLGGISFGLGKFCLDRRDTLQIAPTRR